MLNYLTLICSNIFVTFCSDNISRQFVVTFRPVMIGTFGSLSKLPQIIALHLAYLNNFIAIVLECFVFECVLVEMHRVQDRLFPPCWPPVKFLFPPVNTNTCSQSAAWNTLCFECWQAIELKCQLKERVSKHVTGRIQFDMLSEVPDKSCWLHDH